MSLKTILYTLWVRFWFFMIALLSLPFIAALVFLVPQKYRYNRLFFWTSSLLYRAVVYAACVPIRVKGREFIPNTPAIFVANHTSSLDIMLLGSLCGTHPHVWLAMSWLTNFITFRYFLPRVAVLVDMSSPQKGVRSLIKTINLVKEHAMHVMIFPEGRRYTDGKVHDFYGGFAILAKKTGLPVIPVRLFNLEKVYPPETFWMHRSLVDVVIGAPMIMGEQESDQEFKDRVHNWFIQQDA